jgi:SAM-dependent methyltransferase
LQEELSRVRLVFMSMTKASPIEQHLEEMLRNKQAWKKKIVLQKAYAKLYDAIRDSLTKTPGLTVELGSGIGAIREFIPEAITTDLFENPWLDKVENAYRLSFADHSIANLILFDVFHHLEFPGTALTEFRRVLCQGGRLVMMEPGFGLLGSTIYHFFHREPVGFGKPITWTPPTGYDLSESGYYAAQGNAWRIFVKGEQAERLRNWRMVDLRKISALSYVASGGFSKPSLFPDRLFPLMQWFDEVAKPLPNLFATRLLVTLSTN